MDTIYFADNIITLLNYFCYLQRKRSHGRKIILYIDNPLIHIAKFVTERIVSKEMRRMLHPPYGPDLSPCL
jgi:hypothetical protein